MDKRRFHQCYRSLRSDPRLDKHRTKKKTSTAGPSINKMYLETKISMLEIIQQGLHLKLDMHCAKEEFLGILEGYSQYDDANRYPGSPGPQQPYHYSPAEQQHPGRLAHHEAHAEQQRHHENFHQGRVPRQEPYIEQRQHKDFHPGRTPHQHKPYIHEQQNEDFDLVRVPHHKPYPEQHDEDLEGQEGYIQQESSGSYRKARVKALYEERKARLHAKRERLESQASSTSRSQYWDNGSQYNNSQEQQHLQHQQPPQGQSPYGWTEGDYHTSEPSHTPDISYCSESDKEGFFHTEDVRNNNTPTKSSQENTDYYQYNDVSKDSDPHYVNMLSTITEENSSSSRNSSSHQGVSSSSTSKSFESEAEPPQIPPRCPVIPKERYAKYVSEKPTPPPPWVELGEYVTLKDPNQSMVSFSENESNMAPPPSLLMPNTTNAFGGSMFSLLGNQSVLMKKDCDNTTAKESPFRYAKSDVISELYTSRNREKSLMDISLISNISSTSTALSAPAPRGLSDTTLGTNPMHSTMIDAQPQPQALPLYLSETDEDSLINRTDDTFDSIDTFEGDGYSHDQRTTMSEPSRIIRAPQVSFISPVRSKDDHFTGQTDLSSNFKTPNNPIPRPNCASPKQTQIPQLCKEHGLHLNYGGPCIFEDSFDLLDNSDGSDIDFDSVNFNSENGSKLDSKRSSLASKISSQRSSIVSKRSSVMRPNSAVDTDCDSSYLSECVDDTHFTNDFSEAENYTAIYDSHKARMRMLRRQTGQRNIKQPKPAIGLSESDLFHDVTSRHLSLRGNRSSPPNIQGLSPSSSDSSADLDDLLQPDSPSILDSTLTSYRGGGSYKESDENSINQTIISCDQRPVSLCSGASMTTCATTTTDESPESNGGMSVPVNSPNITDSGGSSSKPTTDTYDYVDVPIDTHKVAKLLKKKLDSHGGGGGAPLIGHHSKSVQSIPSTFTPGGGGKKDYAPSISGGSHKSYHSQAKTAYSDPVLLDRGHHYPHQTKQKNTRYPRSQDSGFATHESNPKPRAHSMDPMHGAHLPLAERPVQTVYSEQVLAHSCHPHPHQSHRSSHRRGHIAISDDQGVTRNVVQHSAVARNLNKDRKKALAKKLRQFNSNFYGGPANPQIRTLGHF